MTSFKKNSQNIQKVKTFLYNYNSYKHGISMQTCYDLSKIQIKPGVRTLNASQPQTNGFFNVHNPINR